LRPLEVYELTPREFDNYIKGVVNLAKAENRSEWERVRWLGFVVSRIAGAKYDSPQDLMLLDHEQPSKAEIESRKKMLKRKFPKKLNG